MEMDSEVQSTSESPRRITQPLIGPHFAESLIGPRDLGDN